MRYGFKASILSIQLMVCQRLDILPQLLQSELRLRFAMRMVKDINEPVKG